MSQNATYNLILAFDLLKNGTFYSEGYILAKNDFSEDNI
jgi:hypothetical protein